MSEKHDKLQQVRLEPFTIRRLKEKQKEHLPLRVSLSGLANLYIEKGIAADAKEPTKRP